MGYWLHVWDGDRDRELQAGETLYSTVSGEARAGDLAVLYLTAPIRGIVAVLRIDMPAEPAPTDLALSNTYWRSAAQTTPVVVFDPPIDLDQLRADAVLAASHPARMNFQRTVFALTGEQWDAFIAVAAASHPGIPELIQESERTSSEQFASERHLEDYLEDNLSALETFIGGHLRLAELVRDGISGRQPVLAGSGSRPDLVLALLNADDPDVVDNYIVVELKNRPAAAADVGQLASYVTLVRQQVDNAITATGLLVTTADTVSARAARLSTPVVYPFHVSIGELVRDQPASAAWIHNSWANEAVSLWNEASSAVGLIAAIDTLTPQEAATDAMTDKLQDALLCLKTAREWGHEEGSDV